MGLFKMMSTEYTWRGCADLFFFLELIPVYLFVNVCAHIQILSTELEAFIVQDILLLVHYLIYNTGE